MKQEDRKMTRRRDMTQREFQAALRKRGWQLILGWIDGPRGACPVVFRAGARGKLRIDRRASLARAIRFHESLPD